MADLNFEDLIPNGNGPVPTNALNLSFDDLVPQAPYSPPSTMDYLYAGPGGAMVQPIERAGQSMVRFPLHAGAALSSLFGLYPNPISDAIGGAATRADQLAQSQNQDYADARNKFENPAPEPVYGTMGSIVPGLIVGAAMGPPAAAQSILGNITRGAVSGAGQGAVMGALNDANPTDQNYWGPLAGRATLGAVTGAVLGGATNSTAPKGTPPATATDFKTKSADLYKQARDAGVVVKSDALKQFSDGLNSELLGNGEYAVPDTGLSPDFHPQAFQALKAIQDAASTGKPITLNGLDQLRQNVGDVAATAKTAGERRLAGMIRDRMDTWMNDALTPSDVQAGNPSDAFHILGQAQDNWQTFKKMASIDQMKENAQNAAGANYSQAGYETALRRQFRQLADNPGKMRAFTPDEQSQILDVVRGAPMDNFFRSVGRFATRGPVSGLATMMATQYGGPVAGAAMTGATEVAKGLATRGTINNVAELQNLISGQAPASAPPSTSSGLLGNPAVLLRLLQSGLVNAPVGPLVNQITQGRGR